MHKIIFGTRMCTRIACLTNGAKDGHPQVNIGTRTMNRERWAPVIDTFIETLRSFEFPGGKLDVRENVKFFGGNWPCWIHKNFPDTGVAIAIEFKKFFMDEWTGEPDDECVEAIENALRFTAPARTPPIGRLIIWRWVARRWSEPSGTSTGYWPR